MGENEIRDIVRHAVSEVLELDHENFSDDADLEFLGADSIQRMEFVAILRKRLSIPFRLDEESRMNSVDDAVEISRNHQSS